MTAIPLLLALALQAQPADQPVATAAIQGSRPAEAPSSDFEFVAWCHGVLSGHMELGERAGERDEVTERVGLAYLQGYETALTLSDAGKTAEGRDKAEAARERGFRNWDAARSADQATQSATYLAWQLPGDCEHAAVRLSGRPNLFASLLGPSAPADDGPVQTASAAAAPTAAPQATPETRDPEGWGRGLLRRIRGWGSKD